MLIIIFSLLLLATITAWRARRKTAIMFFLLSLGLAWIYFYHHLTSQLSLAL